jgi:hypothetical protein
MSVIAFVVKTTKSREADHYRFGREVVPDTSRVRPLHVFEVCFDKAFQWPANIRVTLDNQMAGQRVAEFWVIQLSAGEHELSLSLE